MLVDLLDKSHTASFGSDSNMEAFRYHVACADDRLKKMGFQNQRQILVNSPGDGDNCDMIVEALDVIHRGSDSSTAVMGCEACPKGTMFVTAGNEWLGAFEQCSYMVDGKFISHVVMVILHDMAVNKITFSNGYKHGSFADYRETGESWGY